MRERLLAYLFGQLDATGRQEVEEALADDERLRIELEYLRRCLPDECHDPDMPEIGENSEFSAASDREALTKSHGGVTNPPDDGIKRAPPEGLAERTCQHVAITTWSAGSLAPADFSSAECGASGWRVADLAVAIGVALAAAALLLPAMQQSRHAARRGICQNNLRYLGEGVLQIAELQDGHVPKVPAFGNDSAGGIFAVELADSGLVNRQSLSYLLVCPSSRLASELREHGPALQVPTREQLMAAEGQQLAILRRRMGGSYAYRVGYMERGRYRVVRIGRSGREPLLADAPSLHLVDFQSDNHGGCGQNVLFDDGRVVYLRFCQADGCDDKIFLNRRGVRAAGLDRDDAVLVPSDVGPAIQFVSEEAPIIPHQRLATPRQRLVPRAGFDR